MADTARWSSYEFDVYSAENTTWYNKAGVYIFCGITPKNQWKAYYIGQTESFLERLPNHERWDEAAQLGATHVHALVVEQAASLGMIESELIQSYRPPLNSQS